MPTPREPHHPAGAPRDVIVDPTPLPMMGDRLDVEGTLRKLYKGLNDVKSLAAESGMGDIEQKLGRLQKVVVLVAAVFGAGTGYAVFIDETATDIEVIEALEQNAKDHNGGIDPEATDPTTHEPVGHHPELREAVEANAEAIKKLQEEVLPGLVDTQKKMDKRFEYQFEFSKWQALVTEAERKRQKPPAKPQKLEDIERDLLLGRY